MLEHAFVAADDNPIPNRDTSFGESGIWMGFGEGFLRMVPGKESKEMAEHYETRYEHLPGFSIGHKLGRAYMVAWYSTMAFAVSGIVMYIADKI
ncbi:MAG: hypothetical protein KJ709_08480 [Nanoarchaeota archaeon]|nr:hypothetical protein [Nanoarchaeota archaeon]